MVKPSSDQAPFDAYAGDYDAALAEGLSVSGEDKNYFAKGRIDFLSKKLNRLNSKTRSALDFGCGTGTSTPLLLEVLRLESVRGVDLSPKSIEVARRVCRGDRIRFNFTTCFPKRGNMVNIDCKTHGSLPLQPLAYDELQPLRGPSDHNEAFGYFDQRDNGPRCVTDDAAEIN